MIFLTTDVLSPCSDGHAVLIRPLTWNPSGSIQGADQESTIFQSGAAAVATLEASALLGLKIDAKGCLDRFNASTADGFIQYLSVYKSENNQDFCDRKLIKEFSARNGFANYSKNIFMIGEQKRKDGEGWLGASLHEITEIFFDGKQDKIISKETKQNILRGNDSSYWY